MKIKVHHPGRISFYLLLILIISACHSGQVSKNKAATSFFENIRGTWKLDNKPMYESWTLEGKDFKGNVFLIKNNDTLIRETVRLILSDTACIYRVWVLNQNEGRPVDFVLRDVAEKMVLFNNPFHDFPTSIQYELKSKDTLIARTYGIINGKEKKTEFRYHRNSISF